MTMRRHPRDYRLLATIDRLRAALTQITQLEMGTAAMSEGDWSHMSGPDECPRCEEAHRIARIALDEAPCDWCSEVAPLREWTHEGGEVEDLCPRCYRAAEEQRARERGV
jgi:hypothetical protein